MLFISAPASIATWKVRFPDSKYANVHGRRGPRPVPLYFHPPTELATPTRIKLYGVTVPVGY